MPDPTQAPPAGQLPGLPSDGSPPAPAPTPDPIAAGSTAPATDAQVPKIADPAPAAAPAESLAQLGKRMFLAPFTVHGAVQNILGVPGKPVHVPTIDELLSLDVHGTETRPEQRGEELEVVRQFLEKYQGDKGPVVPEASAPASKPLGVVRDFSGQATRAHEALHPPRPMPDEDVAETAEPIPGARIYELLPGSVFQLGGFPCEYLGEGRFCSRTPIETVMQGKVDAWVREGGWPTATVHKPQPLPDIPF